MSYRFAAITGASSGIGKAIALKMAKEGISVALFARREEKVNEVADEIKNLNSAVKTFPFQGDVRNKDSIGEFLSECESVYESPDIFVNNAGIACKENFPDIEINQLQEMVETNFNGSIWSIYHAMRLFEKKQKGTLINISSTTVLKPSPHVAVYAATKMGIAGLMRSLEEKYLTHKNIKLVNLIPGPTMTDFHPDPVDPDKSENLIAPEDIANWAWLVLNSPTTCKVSNLVMRNSGKF